MTEKEFIDRTCKEILEMMVSLRRGDGVEESKFSTVRKLLMEAEQRYRASDVIPKKLAHFLCELHALFPAHVEAYPKELQKALQKYDGELDRLVLEVLTYEGIEKD